MRKVMFVLVLLSIAFSTSSGNDDLLGPIQAIFYVNTPTPEKGSLNNYIASQPFSLDDNSLDGEAHFVHRTDRNLLKVLSFNKKTGAWTAAYPSLDGTWEMNRKFPSIDSLALSNLRVAYVNETIWIMTPRISIPAAISGFSLRERKWTVSTDGAAPVLPVHSHNDVLERENIFLLAVNKRLFILQPFRYDADEAVVESVPTEKKFLKIKPRTPYDKLAGNSGYNTVGCYQSVRLTSPFSVHSSHMNSFVEDNYFYVSSLCQDTLRVAKFDLNKNDWDQEIVHYIGSAYCSKLVQYSGRSSAVIRDSYLYVGTMCDQAYSIFRVSPSGNVDQTQSTAFVAFRLSAYFFSAELLFSAGRLYIAMRSSLGIAFVPTKEKFGDGFLSDGTNRFEAQFEVQRYFDDFTHIDCYSSIRYITLNVNQTVFVTGRCTAGTNVLGVDLNHGITCTDCEPDHRVRTNTTMATPTISSSQTQSGGPTTRSVSLENTASPSSSISASERDAVSSTTSGSPSTTRVYLATPTRSLSVQVNGGQVNTHAPANTTQAPSDIPDSPQSPPTKDSSVVLQVILPSEAAADAVAASSASSAVVTSMVSPTAGAQVARMGAALRTIQCDIGDDEERPSFIEHPVQFAVGDGQFKYFAGAIVGTSSLILLPVVATFILFSHASAPLPVLSEATTTSTSTSSSDPDEPTMTSSSESSSQHRKSSSDPKDTTKPSWKKQLLSQCGVLSAVFISYFLPSVAGTATTVIVHGNNSTEQTIGWVGVAFVFGCFGGLLWKLSGPRFMAKSITVKTRHMLKLDFQNTANNLYVEAFGSFFDATRNADTNACRLFFVEDIGAAVLMAIIAGLRVSCYTLAATISAVALLHLLYLLLIRPYLRRIDTIFTIIAALINVALALACAVAAKKLHDGADEDDLGVMDLIAYCVLLQSAVFFVQAIVQFSWYYYTMQRRRMLGGVDDQSSASDDDDVDDSDHDTNSSSSDGSDREEIRSNKKDNTTTKKTSIQKHSRSSVEGANNGLHVPLLNVDEDHQHANPLQQQRR